MGRITEGIMEPVDPITNLIAKMRNPKSPEGAFVAEVARQAAENAENYRSNLLPVVAAALVMDYVKYIHDNGPHPTAWFWSYFFVMLSVMATDTNSIKKRNLGSEASASCLVIAMMIWAIFVFIPWIFQ